MCLHTTQLKPHVAKSDMTCYKVLTKDLVSPCYNQQYVLGEKIESVLNHFRNTITKGLHTFACLEYACNEARYTIWYNKRTPELSDKAPIVVKCIIPQGSLYYSSHHYSSPSAVEYASNQLIPLEIIYDATENVKN